MGKINVQMFKNPYELAEFIENTPVKNWGRGHKLSYESSQKLKYGDMVNVEALKCNIKTFGYKNVKKNDFCGQIPVPARAVQSNPYSFINVGRQKRETKYITICYDQSVPWYYDAKKIIENGQRLLRSLKYLEQNNYRIRLYGCTTGTNIDTNMMLCLLKNYDQPFSLSKIAFAIANPLWLRDVNFAWADRSHVTEFQSGYGCPAYINWNEQSLANGLSYLLGRGVIFISQKMVESKPNLNQEENDASFVEKLEKMSEEILKRGFENSKFNK